VHDNFRNNPRIMTIAINHELINQDSQSTGEILKLYTSVRNDFFDKYKEFYRD